MHTTRRLFLNLVFGGLILGAAYEITVNREPWPFSQSRMFSGAQHGETLTWLRLFGVTQDGREFALASNDYIAPFDLSGLPSALRQMLEQEDGRSRVAVAVTDCLRRYEALRVAHQHGGPPLEAMRLYEVDWRIDPDAANVDRPDSRTLLAEVKQP